MYIEVHVTPWAKQESIAKKGENTYGQLIYAVKTRAKPTDNEANDAVQALLAAHLGVPKRSITLVRWNTSRIKFFYLDIDTQWKSQELYLGC